MKCLVRRPATVLPLLLAGAFACRGPQPIGGHDSAPAAAVRFVIESRVLHRIDPKLFGQFLERPSWGEIGIEGGVVPGTHELQPSVLERLREMRIPILRFPGGTDVDYMDWRDMVDHVPGREGGRPVSVGHQGHRVTNAFGYDEFLRLCADLGAEPLVVVNLGDALRARKPPAEAARHAASLVAYCNAPVGARLPEGVEDWPAVRAKNGRAEPYGVRYVQIGNETWSFLNGVRKRLGHDAESFHVDCVEACVTAIRAVDPSVRILVDAVSPGIVARIQKRLGDRVQYLVQHEYMPWRIERVEREGKDVPLAELTAEDVWKAWVAIPQSCDERGESAIGGVAIGEARRRGYRAAVTEWNWNGRWAPALRAAAPLDSLWAKGVGAAGYLHAFMRSGDVVDIACQSMAVGIGWDIAAIHADREARDPAFTRPTGQVTAFYSAHHGTEMLALRSEGVPTYEQPLRMGGIAPRKRVATLDAVATADARSVYVHIINRHFTRDLTVAIDVSAVGGGGDAATHHVLEGRLHNAPRAGEPREAGRFRDTPLKFDGRALDVTLPARSVSCVEIPRR